MINHAVIVNGDFIVWQKIDHIYNDGEITVDCDAIMKTFMASKQKDIEGGILYTNGCPDLINASMIIAAKLKKVVFNREPINSDEMCALELIKENGITVVCNPNIIL